MILVYKYFVVTVITYNIQLHIMDRTFLTALPTDITDDYLVIIQAFLS